VLVHASIIGEARWPAEGDANNFAFFSTIWERHRDRFAFVDIPCTWYNKLFAVAAPG
jgi:hypothetical protein